MKNIDKVMELMANDKSIYEALAEVYENCKVKIPVSEKCLSIPVYKMKFNNRALHCFEKLQLETYEEVIDYLSDHHWNTIDSFGEGTAKAVFERLLEVAWNNLNTKERAEFLIRVADENVARAV